MNDRRRFCHFALSIAVGLVTAVGVLPARAADDVVQTRSVAGFDKIRLEGAFTTQITAGKHPARLVLSAAPDVLNRVTSEVRDSTLVVGMRAGNSMLDRSPKLTIDVAVLRGFENNGAGSIVIDGLTGGDIAIANSGAASIVVSGRAANATISLNGTGRIDTTAVDAGDVTVDNNGVGSIHVRAHGELTMNVNGVGEIRYTGKPTDVHSSVNGIGRIGRL